MKKTRNGKLLPLRKRLTKAQLKKREERIFRRKYGEGSGATSC